MTLNIFDQYGRVIPDVLVTEADEIEKLSDADRQKLISCVKAAMANQAGADRILAARQDIRAKESVYADALEADTKANPPITAHQALKAAIDANADRAVAQPKVNKKTRAALDAAELALAEARIELQHAVTAGPPLEKGFGAACDEWRKCLSTPSDMEVRREYIASSNAARIKAKEETGSAETVKIVPANQWPLQTAMQARGRQENRHQQLPTRRV